VSGTQDQPYFVGSNRTCRSESRNFRRTCHEASSGRHLTKLSSAPENVSGAAPKSISVLTAMALAQTLTSAAHPQQRARAHWAAGKRVMTPVPVSEPLRRAKTSAEPVGPTQSAQSRFARRNGSIRPGAAVGDSGVPPGGGIAPTALSQKPQMTHSCVSFLAAAAPSSGFHARFTLSFAFLPQKQSDAKSHRCLWSAAEPALLLLYGGERSRRWVSVYEVRDHAPNRRDHRRRRPVEAVSDGI
jgi:hypothetical protein